MRRLLSHASSRGPRSSRARVPTLTAGLAALLLAGCYSVEPLQTSQPEPNANVVAHLTDEGAVRLASMLGGPAEQVEGVVQSNGPEGLTMSVNRVSYRTGVTSTWRGESLVLPPDAVGWFGERRLDKTRSYVAAAGLTVGAILIGRLIGTAASTDGGETEPPTLPPF